MKTKRYHWFARENEILLDLDTPKAIRLFRAVVKAYRTRIDKLIVLDSVTTGHQHVFITLKHNYDAEWRLECARNLGSDPKRASADRARLDAGATAFQCLIRFDKPATVRKPDLICLCPMMWKGERLRACVHLRNYEPHCWQAGVQLKLTDDPRINLQNIP